MTRVTIRIEEGPFSNLGPTTEVTVRDTSTAAALAGALAAVMPRVRVEWLTLIRAARLARAGAGQGSTTRTHPLDLLAGARPLVPQGAASGLGDLRVPRVTVPTPIFPEHLLRGLADSLARGLSSLHRAAGPRTGQPVVPPRGAERRPGELLVLPDEARAWNAQHPDGPRVSPGSVVLPAGVEAPFLAWRASRALEASSGSDPAGPGREQPPAAEGTRPAESPGAPGAPDVPADPGSPAEAEPGPDETDDRSGAS
jgi:hypothetical protein